MTNLFQKKQNLIPNVKRSLLYVMRFLLAGFGFANQALAGYATSTTFVSSVITLDSAYRHHIQKPR